MTAYFFGVATPFIAYAAWKFGYPRARAAWDKWRASKA